MTMLPTHDFKETKLKPAFLLAAVLLLPLDIPKPLIAQSATTQTENSYTHARQILERGIEALGGTKNFQTINDIAYKSSAKFPEIEQSVSPDGPAYPRPVTGEGVLDFQRKRSYRVGTTTFLGGATYVISTVITDKTGFTADLTSSAVYPLAAPAIAGNNRAIQRTFPHLILQTALSRATTLRWLTEETYEGRKQQVITYADFDGNQLTLFFNAETGLPTKIEILVDRLVEGLTATETIFSDYRDVNNVKIPFHVVTKTAGEITQDLIYGDVKFNTHPADALFEMPEDAEIGPEVGGATQPVTLAKLAKDIYYVNAVSTPGIFFYSSMFVAFKDYVLVIEAPLNDAVAQAVIAKIKETAPGKPIKYLIPTHYHSDHTGGIRGYIASGSTIVTTPGNKNFIERIASVSPPLNPDSLSLTRRPLSLETFKDKRVFSDGEHVVEFYNVGPSPHAMEILIAYFPLEKIVFASDIFPVYFKGKNGPTSPVFIDAYKKFRELGLQIETIASGHGRLGTMDELKQAVERAERERQSNKEH
jgi:glyoxylase-like metal-dependent hydrolase (beta-lactamase superfamily II)